MTSTTRYQYLVNIPSELEKKRIETKKVKVFYARSSHRETTDAVYFNISEYFDNHFARNIEILDVDNSIKNTSIFLECITKNLDGRFIDM
jgi:hypothetical protein